MKDNNFCRYLNTMGKQELCVSDVTDICEVDCLECEPTFVVYEENHNVQYKAQLLSLFSKTTSFFRILPLMVIIHGKRPTI